LGWELLSFMAQLCLDISSSLTVSTTVAGLRGGMRVMVVGSALAEVAAVRNSRDLPGMAGFDHELRILASRRQRSNAASPVLPSGEFHRSIILHCLPFSNPISAGKHNSSEQKKQKKKKKQQKQHHFSHIRLIRWTQPVSRDIGEHN